MPKGVGYPKPPRKKKVTPPASPKVTGHARALSNPGAAHRSERATEMLRKHAPAIKKMTASRRKRKNK